MAMYFNEPDHSGHQYGPDSAEVNTALGVVDEALGRLWEGLQNRSIEECVNIMIVSDHGMSRYNSSDLVHVNEVRMCYVNLESNWPGMGMRL